MKPALFRDKSGKTFVDWVGATLRKPGMIINDVHPGYYFPLDWVRVIEHKSTWCVFPSGPTYTKKEYRTRMWVVENEETVVPCWSEIRTTVDLFDDMRRRTVGVWVEYEEI